MTRYSRIEQVELVGSEGMGVLRRSTVAILGVGNIGGETARQWAVLGGRILLVDRDIVREENLGTQGFEVGDLGLSKVEARARSLAGLNPECRVEGIEADVARLGLGALAEADLIFSCVDNRRTRTVINEIASRLGVPWIDAAVDGSGRSCLGRVAAYDPRPAGSACYLCPYDRQSLGEIMREGMSERCPVWRWDEDKAVIGPTFAIPALGSAVAAHQVIWGLKLLLGHGEKVGGREIYLDPDLCTYSLHTLRRNRDCLFDHLGYTLIPLDRGVDEMRVGETFEAAEKMLGGDLTVRLNRRSIVLKMRCPDCGEVASPCRMLESMEPEEAACRCGELMHPAVFGLSDRFNRYQAADFLGRTWGEVGLPSRDVLTVTNGAASAHLLFS